jgi:hypothetical protein
LGSYREYSGNATGALELVREESETRKDAGYFMKKTFPSYLSFEYVQVWRITEMKDGYVYKTVPVGYAHRDRPKGKDEVYSPLSTNLTKQQDITLELME